MSSKRGNTSSRDERLYKALSHPLRFQILAKLNESPSSPSDLAAELGEKVGNVAYHVRTLLDLDTVELVKTEQVRGTLEHFYRATARPSVDGDHWTRLPVSIRRQFADSTLAGLWEHAVEADRSGAFDGPDAQVSRPTSTSTTRVTRRSSGSSPRRWRTCSPHTPPRPSARRSGPRTNARAGAASWPSCTTRGLKLTRATEPRRTRTGSSPLESTARQGEYRSGQTGCAVNALAQPSQVRILSPPCVPAVRRYS
jgi:DNA-binding transcriptional ArsR family regulator